MAQIENGLRTDYMQDVAAALPQVLLAQQGGTVSKYPSISLRTSLRGLGLIGEQNGETHSTGSGQAGPNAAPAVWQYHLPDALGSVRQIADPTGQLLLTQRFDPFGGLVERSTLNVQTAYGFAGEEQDPESGQLFLRARTYNPATGRFLQSDPVMGSPADPRTLHHYAYAFNNPVNYADPSGLWVGTLQRPREQRQNSPFQNLTNNYSAQARTQGGYRGPAGRGGFNQAYLGQPGQASGIGAQRAATGPEAQNWQPKSDPQPRQQSQGHRQKACGISSGSDSDSWWGVISITLDFIPVIGDFKSIIEATVGYDLAGNKLSQTERTLMLLGGIAGMFTVFDEIADVARLGSKLLDNGDEVIDVLRASKGLGKIDNVADVGRSLDNVAELAEVGRGLDHIDEITDVGRSLDNLDEVAEVERTLDNLDEATDLARTNNQLDNMDELMGEQRVFSQAETRAAFSGGSDGALSRRIEQNRLNNLSEFTNGDQALKQGDELRQALTNSSRSGRLDKRIEAAQAWREMGADLNDPAIRHAINKGRGPVTIQGGSGALDDVNNIGMVQK
ncbi:MAG: hypothetical protein HS114_22795 [Anaerolineales bacterium]|nr:hypothetical protein [Anaerolineales bacterium]